MSKSTVITQLDLRGKTITTFILFKVHEAFVGMEEGDQLEITTDAFPAIGVDVRTWCRASGHRLLAHVENERDQRFTIEKGAPQTSAHKLAAVISDDGLFELLSPLGFALAAALEGHQVSLFFQGPAVHVLARSYRAQMHGIGRVFSRFPRLGLEKAGHLSPQDKIRQLQQLGARIYACGPSMDHYKVPPPQLAFDDVTVAEYLTFTEQMAEADIHLYM